jgi:hypothetical protein
MSNAELIAQVEKLTKIVEKQQRYGNTNQRQFFLEWNKNKTAFACTANVETLEALIAEAKRRNENKISFSALPTVHKQTGETTYGKKYVKGDEVCCLWVRSYTGTNEPAVEATEAVA